MTMGTKKKKNRESENNAPAFGERRDQLVLWTLRTLVHTEAAQGIAQLLDDDDVRTSADIEELPKPPGSGRREIAAFLRNILKTRLVELESGGVCRDDQLFANVTTFGRLLDLSELEQELLAFVVESSTDRGLRECCERLPRPSTRKLARSLAAVLGFATSEVITAISNKGTLVNTGLIRPQHYRYSAPFETSDELDEVLLSDQADDQSLLKPFFKTGTRSSLCRHDYAHTEEQLDLLTRYLSRALEKKLQGVNVLIHGPPGTGKTQLARLMAEEADARLYEVDVEDSDGDWIDDDGRLTAYLTCQRVLRSHDRAVVLFDEIEDVFPVDQNPFFGSLRRSNRDKGWINRALEENPAPAIWVSNEVQQIDPAYLRRFDYVLELGVPPRGARRKIIKKQLDGLSVQKEWIERVAENENVTPADVERAVKVARVSDSADKVERVVEQVLAAALKVRGHKERPRIHGLVADEYDIGLLNTKCDLRRLVDRLGQRPAGSILFYGPPGTGKTAFAYYLAKRLDMELLHRRASDILSMWVGGTEANLARMFQEAHPDRDILLLDEADSFLRERRNASRSWEVTQVNELLVQMEAFKGLFICSTNLIKEIDQAAFRRFALKINFDYLRSDQRHNMFERFLDRAGQVPTGDDASHLRHRLDQLSRLTPGDFTAVARRFAMFDVQPSADELLDALKEELSFKRGGNGEKLGFGR